MNNNDSNSLFGFVLLALVFLLGFVAYNTGIPIDALLKSAKTFILGSCIVGAAFYFRYLPFTITSIAAGFFWLIEGKNLMLAKANPWGSGKIYFTTNETGLQLPWYATDWFIYALALAFFAGAFFFFKRRI